MKLLTLVRHAEADRHEALADRDRPLNARGLRDAPAIAARLAARGLRPDRLLASPALRTATTAGRFAATLGIDATAIQHDERLYLASAGDLLDVVRSAPEPAQHLMIFGHNPGISDFARLLCHDLPVFELPPAGACAIRSAADRWSGFEAGPLELLACERP